MTKKQPAHKILLNKWSKKNEDLRNQIREKHSKSLEWLKDNGKNLAVGSLGSLVLFSSGTGSLPIKAQTSYAQESTQKIDKKAFLISDLSNILPETVGPLTSAQEEEASSVLSRNFGLNIASEIDGKRLNTTYGLIGAEQHLARYPGDNIDLHFNSSSDASTYTSSGMAPGLGAWGYFAHSESQMTKEDSDREKYYIAVQTFLSAGFNQRFAEYRDFYKYRKMLVVNPNNGRAIVVVIGDAGPAVFTKKHLGGSPEVMKYLERVDGAGKGPVLYYFINDPDNKIPLGPIDIVQ
jgi:hypothetical protein